MGLTSAVQGLAAFIIRGIYMGAGFGWKRPVHMLPGVTGSGTSLDPYRGWGPGVASSPAGTVNYFCEGEFEEDEEVRIANNRVSLIGASESGSIVRVKDPRPNMAVVRYKGPTALSVMNGVRIRDLTFDGGGVTENGLILRDVNFSAFTDLNFVNSTKWSLRTSRGICNKWRYRIHGGYMATRTENGAWFGEGPVPDRGDGVRGYPGETEPFAEDWYVTCSTWDACETNFLVGIGLKIRQCFSLKFLGGAVEGCGVNLDMDNSTASCTFLGTDLELALNKNVDLSYTAGIKIGGTSHKFENVNWIGSDVIISGQGNHRISTFFGGQPNTFTNNGELPSWYESDGNNTPHSPFVTVGSGKTYQQIGDRLYSNGRNLFTLASSDSLGPTGVRLFQTGLAEFCMIYAPDVDKIFFARHGGLADTDYTGANLSNLYALMIQNRNVTVGGTLAASNLDVINGNATIANIQTGSNTLPADRAGIQFFVYGSRVAYMVQYPGDGLYFASTGGMATDLATMQNNFSAKMMPGRAFCVAPVAPATAASAGVAGQITYDNGFVYVCVATNTWKRAALTSW